MQLRRLPQNLTDFLPRPSRPSFAFALRTTATALVALLIGMLLGLQYPFWAAMTVIVIAQPTRGMVFARGFYRIVGTCIGAAAGTAMLLSFGTMPPVLILMLAVWVGVCTAAANVLHAQRGYGAVLAAITAALVALLAFEHPERALSLDASRILAVLLGIIVSSVAALLLVPDSDRQSLLEQARQVALDSLDVVTGMLRHGRNEDQIRLERRLVAGMAALDSTADQVAAASRLRSRLPYVRALMGSVLSLLSASRVITLHMRNADSGPLAARAEAIATVLAQARNALVRQPSALADARTWLRALRARIEDDEVLRDQIREIDHALTAIETDLQGLSEQPPKAPGGPLIRHRDWAAARVTGLRAALGIGLIGGFWWFTGWESGGPMLMAAAIMCGIFATHPVPASGVLGSLVGALLAFVAALLCRRYLQPHFVGDLPTLLLVAPFLLAGTLAIAHRPTAIAGTDFCMMFLFMLEPGLPVVHSVDYLLTLGTGIVAGVAAIALVFTLVLPLDPVRRLRALSREIVRDLQYLAAADRVSAVRQWRARAYHRVLRLVLRADRAGKRVEVAVDGGLAAIAIGNALLRLQGMSQRRLLPSPADRAVEEVRSALSNLMHDPAGAEATARRAAQRLAQTAQAESPVRHAHAALLEIAEALTANPVFFREAVR